MLLGNLPCVQLWTLSEMLPCRIFQVLISLTFSQSCSNTLTPWQFSNRLSCPVASAKSRRTVPMSTEIWRHPWMNHVKNRCENPSNFEASLCFFHPKIANIQKTSVAIGCLTVWGFSKYGSHRMISSFLGKTTAKNQLLRDCSPIFLFEWRFLRQGLCDIFHTPKIGFFLVLKCKQKNIRTTRAGREKTGVFSFYPVPRLKIVKIWPQNIHHAGHCYLNNMRFTGLPLFIPLDVTPVLSCHFFGSIEHLIPEVSEALQNSWLASSFFHAFLEGGCPVFLGSYFWPPWFSIWIINYLVILSEATIEFFVARDSWLSPQEIHPLPILLVKFHYFSQLTLTTSIPTCCTSDVFFVLFYCSQEIQVTQDFGGSTHSPLCHHDLNASQL